MCMKIHNAASRSVASPACLRAEKPWAFVITKQTQIKAVGYGGFPPDVTRLLTFSSQAPANEVSHDEPRHPETFLFFPFQLGWLLLRWGPSWSSLNKGGLWNNNLRRVREKVCWSETTMEISLLLFTVCIIRFPVRRRLLNISHYL